MARVPSFMISQIQWAGYGAALAAVGLDPDLARQALIRHALVAPNTICKHHLDTIMKNGTIRSQRQGGDRHRRQWRYGLGMAPRTAEPVPLSRSSTNEAKSNAAVADLKQRASRRYPSPPTSPTNRRSQPWSSGRCANSAGATFSSQRRHHIRKAPTRSTSRNGTA